MRILVVTNLFPSRIQPGRAPFNLRQCRALAMDHEVRIIAPIAITDELRALRCGERVGERRVLRDGMIVEHPRHSFTPRVMRGLYGRFYERSIRSTFLRLVEESRPDAVLACWAYPDGWAAARLARSLGIPCAIKVHGSDVLTPTSGSARARGTAEALGAADRVIAVSEHLARAAVASGADPQRVVVVRNGVDRDRFSPGSRADARRELGLDAEAEIILFAGNLVPVKGPDILVRAFASVAERRPRARCVLLGDGPMRGALERFVRASRLNGRVQCAGATPMDRMPTWFRAANLLVIPSRSEGIPNVLLEASACGTPWIATAVGGIGELLNAGDGAHCLVPPENPAALACAMVATLDAPAARPLPTMSWADSGRAIASALEDMIASRRQPVGVAA
jgi:glycosyltransferase involved in cell wall biosynthesis